MISDGYLTLKTGEAAGDRLYFRRWHVDAPKAVILIAHGYAEHLGRYEHVAKALNDTGYAVLALDHWGHGKSDGVNGFVPAFSIFESGLDELLGEAKTRYPDRKRFLIGHSLGGVIAANFLASRQTDFAGAVFSGPSIRPAEPPKVPLVLIGKMLSRLAPKAGLIGIDANLVSRDPAVVAAYVADPLVYKGKISARFAAEFLAAMGRAEKNAASLRLPMLIMHGSIDGLASPGGSHMLHASAPSADKTLKIWDGFFHEIFNDPGKEDVIAELIGWLDRRAT